MIYADGMHGRFRLGYGAQLIHVAAATAEDRAEIDDLVACDADTNAGDASGCTPLHCAAWNNPVAEAAKGLFEAGADPEAARLCHQCCQRRLHRGGAVPRAAILPAATMPSRTPAARRAMPARLSGKPGPTGA